MIADDRYESWTLDQFGNQSNPEQTRPKLGDLMIGPIIYVRLDKEYIIPSNTVLPAMCHLTGIYSPAGHHIFQLRCPESQTSQLHPTSPAWVMLDKC